VEIVSVEEKFGVPEDGEKLAYAPDGRPEADRLTVPVNPTMDETETVAFADSPCTTSPFAGLTETLKSGTPPPLSISNRKLSRLRSPADTGERATKNRRQSRSEKQVCILLKLQPPFLAFVHV